MDHAAMTVSWNWGLVLVSYVIAVFASYTALDLAGRVVVARGSARMMWLVGGAIAMGIGIWSMHFTGMLAFEMDMPVSYDLPVTLLSVVIAVAASGLALFVISRGLVGLKSLLVAGPVMGAGIAAMHYTGMAAMRMEADTAYDPGLVALSVLIAVMASVAALCLSFRLNRGGTPWARVLKVTAATIMGAAIAGMHYTGMAAATFMPDSTEVAPSYDLNAPVLGFGIGFFTLIVLGLALASAVVDRKFSAKTAELKKSQEALRESDERFRTSFDSTSVGMALVALDGRWLQVNQALCKVTGYSEEELLARTFQDITHPDDLDADLMLLRKLTNGEIPSYQMEKRYIHAEGRIIYIKLSVSLVTDVQNQPLYAVAQIEDLSEHKRAEEELHRADARYRTLVERMPAVTILQEIGSSSPAQYISPQIEALTGYSPEDCKDPDLRYRMVHPEDRDWIQAEDERPYEPDDLIVTEYRVLHRDGRTLWVRNESFVVEDETSGTRYWQGFIVDITERKKAEEALRKSEERYRSVVDSVKEVIFQTDAQGRWTFLNPAWTEITGFPVEESLGESFSNYVYPEDRERNLALFQPLIERQKEYCRHEIRYLTRGGGFRWIEVWARLTLSEDGSTVTGTSGTLNDITDRKQAEEELKEQQRFLRQVIDTDPSMIFVKDSDGKFTLANKALADVYDTTVDELIGRSIADFNPNHAEAYLRADREVMSELQSKFIPEEEVTDLRTGKKRWFQTIKVPILSPDGSCDRVLGVATDITERKRAEELLKYQALHDPLTGLPNRVLFANRLKQALARVERRKSTVAVLFVDLDNFKVVNDSLGHEAGDLLLSKLGDRLMAHLRSEDTLARFGGDEFAILLADIADDSQASIIAERITEDLQAPFILGDREIVLTASVGVVLSNGHLKDPAHLLRAADTALYRAKNRGKSRYEVFDHTMNTQVLERLDLEEELRRAVEHEEFVIHYQPTVELATGRVVGAEALLRWESPVRGLILPDEFVPVAEETGLIRAIGRWVLREASLQAQEWLGQRSPGLPFAISVNLSTVQFRHPQFIEDVAQVLEETGIHASCLMLEITESMLMDNAESSVDTLKKLKSLGIRLAIDDFGTGYSSFAYLKRFPLDMLKIDRSFIGGLTHDSGDTAIVRAVLGLGHALDLQTSAEGVESIEQLSQLQRLGCELGQGCYFAEPLPSYRMKELLGEIAISY